VALLSADEIERRLAGLSGWEVVDGRLRRRFTFPSFSAAMQFVNRVATLAEELDHHPDILVEYTRVTLSLVSHDAGGLTARDFRFASALGA
jgi:4a-hydroxytetrahydrobiopterin dehydratase